MEAAHGRTVPRRREKKLAVAGGASRLRSVMANPSHKPSFEDDPWTGERLVVLMFGTLAVAFTILYLISP